MTQTKRKIAVILAADVVGYSRLMEADDVRTLRSLNVRRDVFSGLVSEHGGDEFGSVGDSLMAAFSSAVDAVNCSLAIQKMIAKENDPLPLDQRMQLRIGLDLGDVIEQGGKLYGDGLNVAARLQSIADPGGICISGPIFDQVKRKVDAGFLATGTRRVKNIQEPVRTYKVVEPESSTSWSWLMASIRRWRTIAAFVVAVLVIGSIYSVLTRDRLSDQLGARQTRVVDASPRQSIAVLPFENRSAEEEDAAFFADGLHDDLLTMLSKIGDLRVISRTSVERFRDTDQTIGEIAAALGVTTVLEGGVQRSGNRVKINVQLIDAATDTHLWAEAFDRQLSVADVFDIQAETADAIAIALQATLTPQEKARLSEVPTQSTQAYDFYLSGREYERGGDVYRDLPLAMRQYERAVAEDPEFALAWTGLSRVHTAMYWFGIDQSKARAEKAISAASRAFALAPDLPEAHVAMAWYHYQVHRDYEEALRELTIAEKHLPADSELMFARGSIYRRLGRWERALASFERATQLDPRNATLLTDTGMTYVALREYVKAEKYFDQALEIAPDAEAYFWKVWIPVFRDGDVTLLKDTVENPIFDKERRLNIGWEVAIYERNYAAALAYLDEWQDDQVTDFRTFYRPKASYYALALRLDEQPELAESQFKIARAQVEEAQGINFEAPLLIALAEALAGLGDVEQAVQLAQQAMGLMPTSRDAMDGPDIQLDAIIRVFLPAGELDAAIEELDAYLASPAFFSIEGLLPNPNLDPIRDDPRFQELVEKYNRH